MAYTLTGQYVHGNGAPRRGRIKFAPSVAIAGDDKVILPSPLTVDLDSGGSFSVPLVGTDDVAYSPSGWVWSCTEVLDGGRTFAFELTADSDIHTLTPVAVPDEYSYLMSDATPRDLGTAAAGTGLVASREDHVHKMPSAADVGASAVGHGHALADITDAGGAAALSVGTTTGTVAAGDDSRFTDARTPTAHASSHAAGQSDAITVAQSQVTGLDTALAAKMPNSVADANSVLYAVTDNTPAALAVPASRIVGRKATGDVSAMTAAETLAVLGVSVTHPNTDDVLVTVAGQTVHYDSGWRDVSTLLANGWAPAIPDTVNRAMVRRVGNRITFLWRTGTPGTTTSGTAIWSLVPSGFTEAGEFRGWRLPITSTTGDAGCLFISSDVLSVVKWPTTGVAYIAVYWDTSDAIPTSLPGTLVSAAPAA